MKRTFYIHSTTGEITYIPGRDAPTLVYEVAGEIPAGMVIYKLRVVFNAWWVRSDHIVFTPIRSFPSPYDNASHRIE